MQLSKTTFKKNLLGPRTLTTTTLVILPTS